VDQSPLHKYGYYLPKKKGLKRCWSLKRKASAFVECKEMRILPLARAGVAALGILSGTGGTGRSAWSAAEAAGAALGAGGATTAPGSPTRTCCGGSGGREEAGSHPGGKTTWAPPP